MTLQEASQTYSKLSKGISLDEVIDDNEFDDDEDCPIPDADDAVESTNDIDAVELPVNGCKDTGLPEGYKLTNSQKWCVAEMRKEMEKGKC